MNISTARKIFNKKRSKALCDNYIYTIQDGRKYCGHTSYFWAKGISLLFCNHKDTKSESQEMEIGEAGQIFTHKNISTALWDNHTWWEKYCDNPSYLWS